MKLDVSDSMFMLSSLDGADLAGGPHGSPIVGDLEPGSSFLTVHGQDQFRPVRVEVAEHDAQPATAAGYDSLCEFSLRVRSGLLVEDFEAERSRVITRRAGDVRVRITVSRTPPTNNPERPSETFLIETWPAPPAPQIDDHPRLTVQPVPTIDPVRATRSDDVVPTDALLEEGALAATRIGELLAQPVAEQSGYCTASILIPRRRRITFNRTAPVCGWMGNGASGYYDEVTPGTEAYSDFDDDRVGYLNGRTNNGTCRRTALEARPNHAVTHLWEWLVPPDGRSVASHDEQVPLLPCPSRLTLVYTDEPDDDGIAWTRIVLTHEQLPSEWAPLMRTVWRAQMSSLPSWALRW